MEEENRVSFLFNILNKLNLVDFQFVWNLFTWYETAQTMATFTDETELFSWNFFILNILKRL